LNFRFAPIALCALVAASTSVAQSTVSGRPTTLAPAAAGNVPHAAGARTGSRNAATCGSPASTGPSSFNGLSTTGNTAGGLSTPSGLTEFAGVVAGCANIAGDFWTAILAGQANTIQPNGESPDYNAYDSVIVGGLQNAIADSDSSVIAAGANNTIGYSGYPGDEPSDDGIVAGTGNAVQGATSFIGAGTNNVIYQLAPGGAYTSSAVIAGGDNNKLTGIDSLIAGGSLNAIGNAAQNQSYQNAAIGGGYGNSISANYATIAGGSGNSATGQTAVVAGGFHNSATGLDGAVLGGTANVASGFAAAIGGGSTNTASGRQAVVAGGERNIAAGMNSFAGGTGSVATKVGSFVWSDAAVGAKTVATAVPNVFLVRASGGVAFYSAANLASGVSLAPGSGAWSTLSDRAAKTGIARIDDELILAKLAALPVSEWSYTTQGSAVRHLGPMAQDFRAAFGLGEDDRHISTVDEEGVALAAIKALQTEVAAKDRKISELDAKYARLAARLDSLEEKAGR
jgi:hypothetical protein